MIFFYMTEYYSYENPDHPSIERGSNLSTFQSGSKYYYMIPSQIVGWDPPTQIFFSDQNNYVDSNPAFHIYTDIDYDFECGGISRVSFIQFYGSWISYVYKKIKKVDLDLSTASMSNDDESIESNIFTLCFALSLMGRKALASASHQGHGAQEPVRIELFLHGLHSLFQVRFSEIQGGGWWILIHLRGVVKSFESKLSLLPHNICDHVF